MVILYVGLWILSIGLITVGSMLIWTISKQNRKQEHDDIFAEWRYVRDTEMRYIDDCRAIEPVTTWRVVEGEKRLTAIKHG